MFETLEVGRKIEGKEFNEAELKLRQELLELQFKLADKPYPVIIIVSGIEGAGKGSVVHRLRGGIRGLGRRRQGQRDSPGYAGRRSALIPARAIRRAQR